MTSETSSQKTQVCPTCGTRLSESATRCLVCGAELTGKAAEEQKAAKKVEKAVQASRMPEITLGLPAALGLMAIILLIGAGVVYAALNVGGRVVELAETEFMVRGRGYIRSIKDLEQIVLKSENGTPVYLRDVARIELAPDERRGLTELNGEGEAVSGIAVQRYGQNALTVIDNIKKRLDEIRSSLPDGTEIIPVYDRSELIHRAIETLKRTLTEESVIVALVCIVFLLHARSALVAILTLPLGVLIAYICMYLLGISSNIMSLGGIAIAIGAMVDAAIVMIENAHKHLERAPPDKPRKEILIEARVLAVADVVEAMATHRPYRPALGLDEAVKEITRNSGTLYDPAVVEACLTVLLKRGFDLKSWQTQGLQ